MHSLLWPAMAVPLIGVIAIGWRWAAAPAQMQKQPASVPIASETKTRIPGTQPSTASTPPMAKSYVSTVASDPASVQSSATAKGRSPGFTPTAAPVNPTPPVATIREEVKDLTPEELAAIPPPPEAQAAMKAGPPPDILRGMQNPPMQYLQGLKHPPPEFKNALNPPGTPPPAPQTPK